MKLDPYLTAYTWVSLVVDTVDKNTPAEGGGRGDQDREYMLIHGWFMSLYDKNHYKIVK